MSLFPAYAGPCESDALVQAPHVPAWPAQQQPSPPPASGDEAALLASDSDSPPPAPVRLAGPPLDSPYYEQRRGERGNLRVSTLYRPGRPEYRVAGATLGVAGRRRGSARLRPPRYWERAGAYAGAKAGAVADERREAEARGAEYRRLLAADPTDEQLWVAYIDFQEQQAASGAAVEAAAAARAAAPHSRRLRARHHAAARAQLAPDHFLTLLRDDIAKEPGAGASEVWARLVWGAACGARGGWPALAELCAAAARARPPAPRHYARLVCLYGTLLRASGQWEQLVRLLTLQVALNFAPLALPAPPADPAAERRLRDLEDKAVRSGLPLSAVWCRVERARAAAHWAPLPPTADAAAADPARAPLAADLAELLRAESGRAQLFHLAVALLVACDVPLLAVGGAGAALRALHGACADEGAEAAAAGAGALLALLAADPAPPAPPRRAAWRALLQLAADPPHYFSDDHGHLSWISTVFATFCEWARGDERDALLGWRVRWQRALLRAGDGGAGGEAARVRRALRRALVGAGGEGGAGSGGSGVLPLAELASLDAEAAAAAGDAAAEARARRALLAAQRRARAGPEALYVARLHAAAAGGGSAAARWATAAAALGRSPPDDVSQPPPRSLEEEALRVCEEECAAECARRGGEGEDEGERSEGEEAGVLRALLPGADEWARARAALCGPVRRRALLAAAGGGGGGGGGGGARWREAEAAALCGAAGAGGGAAARALLARHPHSLELAALSGAAGAWAPPAPVASPAAALSAALPPLLAAAERHFEPRACAGAARRLARLTRAGARVGALVWALRLEMEARAGGGGGEAARGAALYRALALYPHAKWLAVRGAAAGAAAAGDLEALLLETGLRVHALGDELHAL